MVVATGNKGIATICGEGVGWFVDDNGLLPINYHVGNFGSGYLDITPEELMPLISNETIDLADFIRSFGDRLENNFYSWVYYTQGYDQSMSEATATMVAQRGNPMIEDYRKLLDLVLSEGLDRIESLTDEELREVMVND